MIGTFGALVALVLVTGSRVTAQPRGGIVRGTIVNGTTGGPGDAERVTLIRLRSGMEPIATLDRVSGSFTLENIEVSGETPYLLQVTSEGVNYNRQVNFGRGYEVEASFTVYDATRDWDDITITTARYLLRREDDRLRIDKLYVIENKTHPKKTLYDPDGTFKFHMPSDVVELHHVAASTGGGMPVPQSASPLPDGSGYVTRTAFKPGSTDFAISYDVDYGGESYDFVERAFYPLPEVMMLVGPADIDLEAESWDHLGLEPDGRFVVLRRNDISPGTPLEVKLSGGSDHAAEIGSPSSSGDSGQENTGAHITLLPDPTRPQKWIIVTLMAAALAYGLLTALVPTAQGRRRSRTTPDSKVHRLRQAMVQLESRHSSGQMSNKSYRKEKKHLEAQLEKAKRKGKH